MELVRTKLAPPALRANAVPRARLRDALDAARAMPLTIVSAPAGFGKTTLVAAWNATRARDCAWLTLEPADNAGLGLARAISVANVLRGNPALSGITVLPLSAAQLILPGDTLTVGQAGNVETRRRIEIRIRRREATGQ